MQNVGGYVAILAKFSFQGNFSEVSSVSLRWEIGSSVIIMVCSFENPGIKQSKNLITSPQLSVTSPKLGICWIDHTNAKHSQAPKKTNSF